MKDAAGKSKPGPARLEIWREGAAGWNYTRLEDPESNVFHKAILSDDGSILTIGAMGAHLEALGLRRRKVEPGQALEPVVGWKVRPPS